MTVRFEAIGNHAGLVSPLIFILAAAASIASYPGYSPLTNYISVLGSDPATGLLFNAGVALSGMFGMVFAGYLIARFPAGYARGGAFLLGTGLLFFTLLSVFTEEAFDVHVFFAGLFFVLAFLAFLMAGYGLLAAAPGQAYVSFAMAGAIALLPLSGISPLSEHVAAAAIIVWSLAMWAFTSAQRPRPEDEYEWLWAYS
jgi:hypothetical membrane protein